MFKHTILVAAVAGMVLALAGSAQASILTFEGKGTNINIPGNWGSNIAAAGTGISVDNGVTPNVVLTWSAVGGGWQFYNDSEWTAAQMDAFHVGDKFDLLFTPDAGYSVLVDSFVFDDYVSWRGGSGFTWQLFKDDENGALVNSGTHTTTDGQDLLINTGMASYYAGPILLRIIGEDGASNNDEALDSISFTQIPEPATLALLGLGGLGVLLGRKRR